MNNLEYFPQKQMPEYIYKEPKYDIIVYIIQMIISEHRQIINTVYKWCILTEDEKTYKEFRWKY